RLDRSVHPTSDRIAAIGSNDSDLAGTLCGVATRLVAGAGVFCDYGDLVVDRLDHFGARSARPLSRAAGRGFRARRRTRGLKALAHYSAAHGTNLPESHHCYIVARHSSNDYQRDLAFLPWFGNQASGH